MNHTLFIALQRLVPQHLISRGIGTLAAAQIPFIKNTFIQRFAKHYGVNMSEALEENLTAYSSFNAFFTRALKPDARPICPQPNTIVSPADGSISQLGAIKEGRIFQAKGQDFTAAELLASASDAEPFMNGQFATVYLSPKDYHRVHMPYTGTLRKMTYIPGQLFSVNQTTAENVPRLFARNERVACLFDTEYGPMAVVLVGAMIVASIETVWAGTVCPLKRRVQSTHYHNPAPMLTTGAEMGRFLLGSTAVVLTPANSSQWLDHFKEGSPIKMGEAMGQWTASK